MFSRNFLLTLLYLLILVVAILFPLYFFNAFPFLLYLSAVFSFCILICICHCHHLLSNVSRLKNSVGSLVYIPSTNDSVSRYFKISLFKCGTYSAPMYRVTLMRLKLVNRHEYLKQYQKHHHPKQGQALPQPEMINLKYLSTNHQDGQQQQPQSQGSSSYNNNNSTSVDGQGFTVTTSSNYGAINNNDVPTMVLVPEHEYGGSTIEVASFPIIGVIQAWVGIELRLWSDYVPRPDGKNPLLFSVVASSTPFYSVADMDWKVIVRHERIVKVSKGKTVSGSRGDHDDGGDNSGGIEEHEEEENNDDGDESNTFLRAETSKREIIEAISIKRIRGMDAVRGRFDPDDGDMFVGVFEVKD